MDNKKVLKFVGTLFFAALAKTLAQYLAKSTHMYIRPEYLLTFLILLFVVLFVIKVSKKNEESDDDEH